MEVEPLLEASGKRNWRSIMLTHDEFPCNCLLQTWWYPGRSNLALIWKCGELLSMGLPDSSQPITIVIVGVIFVERKQLTRNAYERAIAGIGLSKRYRSF